MKGNTSLLTTRRKSKRRHKNRTDSILISRLETLSSGGGRRRVRSGTQCTHNTPKTHKTQNLTHIHKGRPSSVHQRSQLQRSTDAKRDDSYLTVLQNNVIRDNHAHSSTYEYEKTIGGAIDIHLERGAPEPGVVHPSVSGRTGAVLSLPRLGRRRSLLHLTLQATIMEDRAPGTAVTALIRRIYLTVPVGSMYPKRNVQAKFNI